MAAWIAESRPYMPHGLRNSGRITAWAAEAPAECPYGLRNSGRICHMDCGTPVVYAA